MKIVAGIDISAKSFDLSIRSQGKSGKAQSFKQEHSDFERVEKMLRKNKVELVVMEATGIYYLDLAVHLVNAGLSIAVINPLSSKRFAELKLSQVKTDAADAALLAEYAEIMVPPVWIPPKPEYMALKDIGRQINRLTKDKVKAKNRLHALQSKTSPLILIEDVEDSIEVYEKRIERLTQAALSLIEADEALNGIYPCFIAAKGIGQASAIAILAEFVVLPTDMKAKQVSRYSGLDIKLNQSGTSVKGASRISKAGNAYLRSALYMPAMSAVQHDANAKLFRENLTSRGKTKLQANVAVMRKYLTGLWAVYKEGQAFDSAKLFNFESKNA
ncbi:IS110 family transposase [Motilimonas eburnea]|uniref:IS110 family transposase n=1 Tax=Motilimonas eburnea TaxID=1737488 RepID=UPI001E3F323A|nr:transposase [Motilimonas eburnea]